MLVGCVWALWLVGGGYRVGWCLGLTCLLLGACLGWACGVWAYLRLVLGCC